MNISSRIIILFFAIPALTISCTKVWQDPDTSIPSKKVDITSVLVMPTIYDGAGVELEGKVWDLLMEHSKYSNKYDYSTFKLADKDGNYVKVKSNSSLPLVTEGEIIKVVGVHRIIHDANTNKIENLVEAYSIEK